MSFHDILTDPGSARTAFFSAAGIAAAAAFLIRFLKHKRNPEARVVRLSLDGAARPVADAPEAPRPMPDAEPQNAAPVAMAEIAVPATTTAMVPPTPEAEFAAVPDTPSQARLQEMPAVQPQAEQLPGGYAEPVETVSPALRSIMTLQERSPLILDILRGALMMLAFVAAAALLLVAMPQGGVDRVAAALRPRNAPGPPPEKIAFLYLGDEVKQNQFHIRGVVRNITAQPIEQLQAVIRLYAPDRTLLETQVVRMDTETLFPNATASFHLSFPEYRGQFGSYSLDFKLAQGEAVLYKDIRETQASN